MSLDSAVRAHAAHAAEPQLGRTIVSIQLLRFVAALAVVLYHAHLTFARDAAGHPWLLSYLFDAGASGVHVFFCISGFVMVYTSYCRDAGRFSASDFLVKRFLRIYPIYWLVAAAYLAFHAIVPGLGYHLSAGELAGALLLTPDDASLVIGPAWTLAFEMYFYLCFCLFMTLGLRTGLLAMTGFFLLCVASSVLLPGAPIAPLIRNPLLLEFVAGAWVGYVAIERPAWLARPARALLLLALVGFAATLLTGPERAPTLIAWGAPSVLLLAGAVGYEAGGRFPRRLGRYAYLGDGSYFLYLSHILLIDMVLLTPLSLLRGTTGGIVALTIVTTVAAVLIAVLAFDHVERPMLRLLRRHLLARRRAAPLP